MRNIHMGVCLSFSNAVAVACHSNLCWSLPILHSTLFRCAAGKVLSCIQRAPQCNWLECNVRASATDKHWSLVVAKIVSMNKHWSLVVAEMFLQFNSMQHVCKCGGWYYTITQNVFEAVTWGLKEVALDRLVHSFNFSQQNRLHSARI